jgi:tetratricopeptide (TPR) repeat protein
VFTEEFFMASLELK